MGLCLSVCMYVHARSEGTYALLLYTYPLVSHYSYTSHVHSHAHPTQLSLSSLLEYDLF